MGSFCSEKIPASPMGERKSGELTSGALNGLSSEGGWPVSESASIVPEPSFLTSRNAVSGQRRAHVRLSDLPGLTWLSTATTL